MVVLRDIQSLFHSLTNKTAQADLVTEFITCYTGSPSSHLRNSADQQLFPDLYVHSTADLDMFCEFILDAMLAQISTPPPPTWYCLQ